MKKVIIVAPHFPPSNLAAVHRSRLFAMHLPSFGWEPIIVTVHHKHYEETPDWNLVKLLPENIRIERVGALPVKPFRLVGDIGIRGFFPMLFRILKLVRQEKIDFLYIPIPSHFAALIGRIAHFFTGVAYGIDYIDPWVHHWPGTEKKFSKHWWSMKMGDWFEPFAVKKAALITGVAKGYYEDVLIRNPHLREQAIVVAMPYGGEKTDHDFVKLHPVKPRLFQKAPGMIDLVYAGAMLPKAHKPLNALLQAISDNKELFSKVRFHFIGTGKSPNDPTGYTIKPYAQQCGLWQSVIFEYPMRIPYLDVLVHLNLSDGIFILGSTEAHYTPSKVYQGVLSEKPIFAVLHKESTATRVIKETAAGIVLDFNGEVEAAKIVGSFSSSFTEFIGFAKNYKPEKVNMKEFELYSAKNVTGQLAGALNAALNQR